MLSSAPERKALDINDVHCDRANKKLFIGLRGRVLVPLQIIVYRNLSNTEGLLLRLYVVFQMLYNSIGPVQSYKYWVNWVEGRGTFHVEQLTHQNASKNPNHG